METITVKGKACRFISESAIGELPYDVAKDHKFAGKKYRTFFHNGIGFTVPSTDKFCKKFDDESLWEVQLTAKPDDKDPTVTRYQLQGGITRDSAIADKRTDVEIESITVENFVLGAAKQVEELEDLA